MLVEHQDRPALYLDLVLLPGTNVLQAVFELSVRGGGQLGSRKVGPVSSESICSDGLDAIGAPEWCIQARPRFPLAWTDVEQANDLRLEIVARAEVSREKRES
jgi:hypothetical protein